MSADLLVSESVLAERDDAELAWRVIAPAYDAVDIYNGAKAFAASIASLSAGQRALLAIHWCIAEVQNGGLLQFFDNPTSVVAAEAVRGFERIGVPDAGELVVRAAEVIQTAAMRSVAGADTDDDVEALRAELYPLDERFYELIDSAIYPRAATYVRSNRSEFVRS
jgi:uncharacterized protein DUF4375